MIYIYITKGFVPLEHLVVRNASPSNEHVEDRILFYVIDCLLVRAHCHVIAVTLKKTNKNKLYFFLI